MCLFVIIKFLEKIYYNRFPSNHGFLILLIYFCKFFSNLSFVSAGVWDDGDRVWLGCPLLWRKYPTGQPETQFKFLKKGFCTTVITHLGKCKTGQLHNAPFLKA